MRQSTGQEKREAVLTSMERGGSVWAQDPQR